MEPQMCKEVELIDSPEGVVLKYSLWFTLPISHNMAEYEALIAILAIPKNLEIKKMVAHSDSQLVVQQFQGTYEARHLTLTRYL